jgi:hypothetical protein
VTEAVKGKLEDFQFYNRALLGAEVPALYTTAVPLLPANPRVIEE